MTTYKDLFIYVLLWLGLFELTHYILELNIFGDNTLLSIPVVLTFIAVYIFFYKKLKNKKRVSLLLEKDFAAMNYTILAERPLSFKEQYENFEFDFGPTINGFSINGIRYKNRMKRHFTVRNENGYDFELIISIIQTWRNKFKYNIDSTSRIRN